MATPPQAMGQTQPQRPRTSLEYVTFNNFQGMDTSSDRVGLESNKLAWQEGMCITGKNTLGVTLNPSATGNVATITGKTVKKIFYANLGGTDFLIVFTTDGGGYTVTPGGVQVNFAPAASFTNPDCTQWQNSRILIADPTAGYASYDTNAYVSSANGSLSPNIIVTAGGSGYTTGATAAFSGGHGSGAAATVTTVGGVVTAVTLTNGGTGYLAGDSVTITISPVGAGSGATATCKVWPQFSLTPTTLCVFAGRVWLAGGRTLTWTGTGGFDDAAIGDASGSTILGDSDLIHSITAVRSLNNFLWIFGDNSIKQIGTVSVSGTTTVFTIVTLSSDIGTSFPNTIISYDRLVLFANALGVYAVLGASVQKISTPMDGIFQSADFTVLPSACLVDVTPHWYGLNAFPLRCYAILIKFVDKVLGSSRTIICLFNQNKWFISNQGNSLLAISSILNISVVRGQYIMYGSSGADITTLMNQSTTTNWRIQTALTDHGKPYHNKRLVRASVMCNIGPIPGGTTFTATLDTENLQQAIVGTTITIPVAASGVGTPAVPAGYFFARMICNGNSGIYVGITLTGTIQDIEILGIVLEYQESTVLASTAAR